MREEAHYDLIRLLAATGQAAAALRQYQELERILKQELDTTPSAAIRDLARAIGDQVTRRPGDQEAVSASPGPPVPWSPPPPVSVSPLPTGTVTFLLTDIEGSTALLERAREAFTRALASHHTLLLERFRQYQGQEEKRDGGWVYRGV